jgi:hypothetical protein
MARILRRLKITDVSSVDAGAGRGVRVVLTKRHQQEVTLNKLHKDNDSIDPETIAKVVKTSHESIARDLMKDDPSLSFQKAMVKALDTPQFSELHRSEKAARHGPGY